MYLGNILTLDSTRLLQRALTQIHQLGLKGSLLMDAPQHNSFQSLKEQAMHMDKATWNARIRGFQWRESSTEKKRSWLLMDNNGMYGSMVMDSESIRTTRYQTWNKISQGWRWLTQSGGRTGLALRIVTTVCIRGLNINVIYRSTGLNVNVGFGFDC